MLLKDELRAGGPSEVRKAFGPSDGEYAAIKLLRQDEDTTAVETFLERETPSLKLLDHPNIVRMLDSGWDGGLSRYFIALKWVDHSLKDDHCWCAWPRCPTRETHSAYSTLRLPCSR
ncbi:hypothetical protein ACIP98_40570 [Streptomyces sp. NPDC088354]|uniref:hypothetical protein n=1 Tax=Streptomyces sp. NPDC088354 TaxID=3365856 RepID=UPI00380AF4A9